MSYLSQGGSGRTSRQRPSGPPYLRDKVAARGKWPYLLEDLAPQLRPALAQPGEHVACPVHGGNNGFRLFADYAETGGGICNTCGAHADGFRLLAWVKGYGLAAAVAEVRTWLGKMPAPEVLAARRPPAAPPPLDPAKALARLQQVARESQPLAGSAAERYLVQRGIYAENMPASLRAHPGLPYWDRATKRKLGVFPCLLAPIRNAQGEMVSIHRIYLTEAGAKAPVPDPKRMMPAAGGLTGAAIKLWPAGEVLGVAEGIETALAAHAITRIPVWSCVAAPLLEQVAIPAATRHVVIFADKDRSYRGQQAAEVLADRLVAQGKSVEVLLPAQPIPEDAKGIDWLDVLVQYGLEGFPPRWRNWRQAT